MSYQYVHENFTDCFVKTLIRLHDAPIVTVKGTRTKELLHYHAVVKDGLSRCFAIRGRHDNPFAKMFESMWVFAGRNDLQPLLPFLPRAADFSDDGETWRAGYGPRLRSMTQCGASYAPYEGFGDDTVDQLQNIHDLLKQDPQSRQAVATIWSPAEDWVKSKDTPCNNWLHFIIRDNKLHLNVAVRSNDAWWGFSGINFFEWSFVLQVMATSLKVDVGSISWNATSMHLYERHWDNVLKITDVEGYNPVAIPEEFPRLILSSNSFGMFSDDASSFVHYFSREIVPFRLHVGTDLFAQWFNLCMLYVQTQQMQIKPDPDQLVLVYETLLSSVLKSDQLVSCIAYLMREIPKHDYGCNKTLIEIMNSTHPDVCSYVRELTMKT